jgi:hypothetical protein
MSEDKAAMALRSYVADYSSEDGMFQPKHYAREFQRILAEIDSKPTPTRIEFRMMGPKLAFSIGNQCFTLDHEPDSDDEAEVMQRMLCHALSGFAPDVKTSGADAQPDTEQAMPVDRQAAFEAWLENYPIQIVEDDYELCFDAFMAGMQATQPARAPLTEEQIIRSTDEIDMDVPGCFIRIARAIERAHGIGEAGNA